MQVNGELKIAQMEQLAADPTGLGLVSGRFWQNTTSGLYKVYSGSAVEEFVEKDKAQTLANKILSGANISDYLEFDDQGAVPSTPSAGKKRLFVDTDDKFKYIDENGDTTPIGSGSGGGINYLQDANNSDAGWTDSGGGLTIAENLVSAIDGEKDLKISKTATDQSGAYVAYPFTIRPFDQGRTLPLKHDFISDAVIADGDYIIKVYDVTNAVEILTTNPEQLANELGGTHVTYFNTAIDSTSYEFRIECATTSTAAQEFQIDNIKGGPIDLVNPGSFISDWVDFTPIGNVTNNTTYEGLYRRVGSNIEIQYKVNFAAPPGAFPSGSLLIEMPPGLTVDETKMKNDVNVGSVGSGWFLENGVARYPMETFYRNGANNFSFQYYNNSSPTNLNNITDTVPKAIGSFDSFVMSAKVPIVGWSTGVKPNEVISGREIFAQATFNTVTNIPSTVTTVVPFDTFTEDTTASGGTGGYVIPESGIYDITVLTQIDGGASNDGSRLVEYVFVNGGAIIHSLTAANTSGGYLYYANTSTRPYKLEKGDLIQLAYNQNGGVTSTVQSNSRFNIVRRNNLSSQIQPTGLVGDAVPAGTLIQSMAVNTPDGYLYCDGTAVSRTTYSRLFAAIGTAMGIGDGSTTFNLPDMRGTFARGQDDGAGLDPNAGTRSAYGALGGNTGDAVGSYQGDENKSHTHNTLAYHKNAGGHFHDDNNTLSTRPSAPFGSNTFAGALATGGAESRPRNVSVRYYVRY